MEYPQLPTGVTGVGSTHHFALVVDSAEELEAWATTCGERSRVHRPLRPRRVQVGLPPRPRRPRRRDRHPGAGFRSRPPRMTISPRQLRAAQSPSANGSTTTLARSPAGGRQCAPLTFGHRPDGLRLRHRDRRQESPAARTAPAMLAHEQVRDGHALGLPGALEDDVSDGELSVSVPPITPTRRRGPATAALERGPRWQRRTRATRGSPRPHVPRPGNCDHTYMWASRRRAGSRSSMRS